MFTAAERFERYERAFAEIDAPFAFVDLDAMWLNSADMLRRIAGKPIRLASKSLRCRALMRAILDRDPGYQGLMTFTLPETVWLAREGFENLLLAYPSADRGAYGELSRLTAENPDGAPVVMVDSIEHLELIESVLGDSGAPIRVCLDFDASYWPAGERVKIGPRRTPVHTPEQARQLAEAIVARRSVTLAGMMSYEGHIAGQGNRIAGKRIKSTLVSRMQRASYAELRERRAAAVAAVAQIAPLAFVNAGGTGDLELVATEPAMTEATAGLGLLRADAV